jgi:hypothetical protein
MSMTENDAAPDRGQRAKLLAGRISCLIALLLGAAQLYLAFPEGSADTSVGILGIAFCILGYYLDSRRLATATIFLCSAAIIISMSALQLVS